MSDDEGGSKADPTDVESDNELCMRSEDDNTLDGEDSANPSDDDIDPDLAVQALKGLKGAFSQKRGRARRSNVENRTRKGKNTAHVKDKDKGKSTAGGSSSRASSRNNHKYFGEIISSLDRHKRDIIKERGFGSLLEYDGCHVPFGFAQWIADQVDVNCCDIVVGGKVIPCSPESIHLSLGLPIGGQDIKEHHNDSIKAKFLQAIKVKEKMPLKRTFATKLIEETLSDDDVFRYFMVVALSFFLCPNSSTIPSPKYLGPLLDVSTAADWNWSKFVFEWLFDSIKIYQRDKRKTIGGCVYFLAAYYLDFLDFGFVRELPTTLPRIKCWTGSMIKDYAKYDRLSDYKFGKRPVKSFQHTCYVADSDYFRETLDKHCDFIPDQDIGGMCELFEEHHIRVGYRNPATLVSKVLKYLYEATAARRAAQAHAESSDGVPANVDDVDGGIGAAPGEYDDLVFSPVHPSVHEDVNAPGPSETAPKEVVLDAGLSAGTSCNGVKGARSSHGVEEVAAAACPSDIAVEKGSAAAAAKLDNVEDVQAKNACPAKTNEDEFSATEIIESDGGLYDGPGTDYCGPSQGTEIVPSGNSSAQESGARNGKRKQIASSQGTQNLSSSYSPAQASGIKTKKRKGNTSQSSPDSDRKMTLRTSTRLARLRPISGVGATSENPLIIEEAAAETCKHGRKGRSKGSASSPSVVEIASDVSPVAQTSIGNKRKQKTPQSSSPTIASRKSPRGVSKKLGRSPLSRVDDANDGGHNVQSPSVVPANPRHKEGDTISASVAVPLVPTVEVGETTIGTATTPFVGTIEKPLGQTTELLTPRDDIGPVSAHGPCIVMNAQHASCAALDENAAADVHLTGKAALVEKHCMKKPVVKFNSPSMPSFRILEDEDDYGNYVEDPKLRRPFPTTPAMSCPVERARSNLRARIAMPSSVATDVYQEVNSREQNWVFVDNLWSNPAVRNEETVVTENDGTRTNDIVETDHIHMVSLPFTECSENAEASAAPVPLAAINSTGALLHIAPIVAPSKHYQEPSVAGGSSLSGRNIVSNGLSKDCDSFSSQDTWQSSSAKLAVHRPRRQFIPSKYKLSPYMKHESKIKVSRLESDMYGIVLSMAESTEHSGLQVINYQSVVVLLSALASSLKPQGKVKYFVVNALCRLMFLRNHPYRSYKHYFFSKVGDYLIGNHGTDDCNENVLFENALRSFKGAQSAKYLPKSHYLYFPILFKECWYVVVVYLTNKKIYILDSCTSRFGVDSAFHKVVCDEFVPNLIVVWKNVVGFEFGFHGFEIKFADVPQQNDNLSDEDSGIFALKNLELYEPNVYMISKYTEDDIAHLRIKYANEMIWNEHNIAHDGRAKVEEYDPEVYEKYFKKP